MITPGQPARSLLYHALASPNVVEHKNNTELNLFPTLLQIDTVENYVFSVRNASLEELISEARVLLDLSASDGLELAVGVFASE